MNALEDYLKHATKGIYGAKKLEIQAELRGSITHSCMKSASSDTLSGRAWNSSPHRLTNACGTSFIVCQKVDMANSLTALLPLQIVIDLRK